MELFNKFLNLGGSLHCKRSLHNSLQDNLPLLECIWGIFIEVRVNSQLIFITF